MISPNTPVGTRIVCIDDVPDGKYNCIKLSGDLDGLTAGTVYTVLCVRPERTSVCGFNVILKEITRSDKSGYSLHRFELAALPKAITHCLTAQPIQFNDEIRERDLAVIRHLMPY